MLRANGMDPVEEKMGRTLKVFGIIVLVAVLIVVLAGVGLWLVPLEREEPPIEPRNTAIYMYLKDGGLDNALVDVTNESVLVIYELPENAQELQTFFYVLGAVYHLEPTTSKIELVQLKNGVRTEYIVPMTTLDAFDRGELTEEQVIAQTKVTAAR